MKAQLHRHILEEVSRASIHLLLRDPFYAHLLACLNKQVVDARNPVKSLALGLEQNSFLLFIQPAFWTNLTSTPDYRPGLLKHEVLHLIFKHPLVHAPKKDRLLVNMAMDLAVNQYISPEALPPDAIRADQFPELQLLPGQTWQYYYQHLEELKTHRHGRYQSSRAAAALTNIEQESPALERHRLWEPAYRLPHVERSILEGVIDHLIEQAYRRTPQPAIAQLPGQLQIHLEEQLRKERALVDWRQIIKIFAAGSARTKIKNTIRRPSKRYGSVPGIKVQRLRKLLVAVDTSGSIRAEERQLFFNEIHHLWRQGAEIHIVECDTDIQHIYEYQGRPPAFIRGGGDTNFDAPIRYGNQHLLPDGLIYLTDGYGPTPQVKARFPILWVISPRGLGPDSEAFRGLPGRKVKLKHE